MERKIFLTLLLQVFLFSFSVHAQKLDSLMNELNNHKKEDAVRLKLLNNVSKAYTYTNLKKALETADSALVLALKLGNKREEAYAYMLKGRSLSWMGGSHNQAFEFLQKALNQFQLLNKKADIASCLNDLGGLFLRATDYPKAKNYLEQAFNIDKELGDKAGMAVDLNNIGLVHLRLSEFQKAIDCFQRVLNLNLEIDNKKGQANALSDIGNAYLWMAEYPKGLDYNKRALKISEELGNKRQIAMELVRICIAHRGLGDYPKALESTQRALKIYEEMDFKLGIADCFTELGDLYDLMSNSLMALEYHKKSLNIHTALNDKHGITIDNLSIGGVYQSMGDYTNALKYEQAAFDMAQQTGSESLMGTTLLNIGMNYHLQQNHSKALEYYKRSLLLDEKIKNQEGILINNNKMGELYRDAPDSMLIKEKADPANRYAASLVYFNKALKIAEEIESLAWQRDAWHNITITYEKQNNYPQAFETYKKFVSIRDSIQNTEKEKKITRLTIQYEFDKKEDSLKLYKEISDGKLQQQLLIAKQQQQQLALNQKELDISNKELDISNKEKDLQKLAYLKAQADLQNEQLEKKGKEEQLVLAEKNKQLQLVKVNSLTQEKELNVFKQRQQWIYIVCGLVLVGLIVFVFFYRARLQQVRLKSTIATERIEQQQKEAEFQRQLGDVSLSALRSQMNPHFIFNCLNSIKLYTTQNDTIAASEYLTKFSRLIRLVLENSRNDRITLASELDALRLYMEMEAMRFKEKLKYNITVDKDVDMDYIEIPPLLLQPYVENAIWHGLMQKEEGGRIDIAVGIPAGESMLVIDIIDNGIGRAKSAALMSKTATKHKSYGMKLTSERLALINRVYRTGANVSIFDLTGSNGEAAGTQVSIKIPLE